jgi:hypothetical protein
MEDQQQADLKTSHPPLPSSPQRGPTSANSSRAIQIGREPAGEVWVRFGFGSWGFGMMG